MSAVRNPESTNRWLTIAAVIALVYALGVIGVGSIGGAASAHSIAHWIGRAGSIAVIIGVLQHQRAVALASGDVPRRDTPLIWNARIAPWTIALGLLAIVAGFVLGVIGY